MPEYFCRRCKHTAVRNIDKTPGSARAFYSCACVEGRPVFPVLPVREEATAAR